MSDDVEKEESSPIMSKFFTAKNVILALIAVLTAYNTFTTNKTKGQLDIATMRIDTAQRLLNLQTTELDNLLKKKEFDNNLKMEMYRETKSAIGKDSITQAAAQIIINEMLRDDSAFLWKLKSIISQTPSLKNNVKVQEKLEVFTRQERSRPTNTLTVDVFYLEENVNVALPRARTVVSVLSAKFPAYNIRLRLLPSSINSQSGYRISTNVLRFDKSEEDIAKEIKDIIVKEKIFQLVQPQMQTIQHRTPNYISIFIRNM